MANIDGYTFWREKLNSARFIVAPMVDQSELPWRMLSRKYAAQLCYTPMMHSAVFVRDSTYRLENFVSCPEDRPLIAQFCSDDPDTFLKAAKIIENDCDAIDLNLGCPQHIARRGHYGSFLQDEWSLIYNILSKAVKNLKIPVTAKIRVFEDIDKSVEYAKMIESTGIAILTVHGRTRDQKGTNTGIASWKHIKAIKDALKIPVFANGNILCYNDVLECLEQTGCDGVMSAECNLYNPALFANLNPFTWDMALEYVNFVEKYPCSFSSIRAHIFKMFHKVFEKHVDLREKMSKIKDLDLLKEAICEIRETCLKDNETVNLGNDLLEYYRCQAYIRPIITEKSEKDREEILKTIETTIANDTSSDAIKKKVEELSKTISEKNDALEQEVTRKLVKLLERKRRKHERIERKLKHLPTTKDGISTAKIKKEKYVYCQTCKNPKSANCDWNLCRSCCKEKIWTQKIECKGHGLKFRIKEGNNDINLNSCNTITDLI